MMSFILKTAAAVTAAAGLAYQAGDDSAAYSVNGAEQLSQTVFATHASHVFERADRNGDDVLNVDEYASLAIVTAQLARLNGFTVVETDAEPLTVTIPNLTLSAVAPTELTRIDAVARANFYASTNGDGALSKDEFVTAISALFEAHDLNNDGVLKKRELTRFAQRQAGFVAGV